MKAAPSKPRMGSRGRPEESRAAILQAAAHEFEGDAETTELLKTAEYPSRDPATNVADLRAQIAANEKGIAELHKMVQHFGLDVVHAYMGHVQENAAESVRRVITALHDGEFAYELDNGARVVVA